MRGCLRAKKSVKIFTRWIAKDRLYLGRLTLKELFIFFRTVIFLLLNVLCSNQNNILTE